MSLLRQVLYSAALLGALGLLLWVQQQRIDLAQARLAQAELARKASDAQLSRQAGTITALEAALSRERQAQADLDQQRQQLRQALAIRERLIEDLKRDDEPYRQWADQLLPDVARRLQQRPAITGAAAYHQWLSRRDALQPGVSGTEGQRRPTD
ncbi:TPA: LysB family phage lysis regulatory protein [Pseudomonas aeruginosa]|nr:LysB family phage lysis regulatory protein [Pseudomonas aeruginosa]HBO2796517.1 LysB family phage lysis regulatory protein [Pseudomonas aeruginosa]HCD6289843.1 LysB family phage lysis regulatory protein [Pseudomonas aeruginosa]HCE8457084.1 LysB family phage lysis regulatory protein [Pseudomonas aeruginosa]HCG0872008.1 LysB family phage lysis regulatory protein [Pseudomonas aeruginosa]